MYTLEKKTATKHELGRILCMFLIVVGIVSIIAACDKDPADELKENPPQENPPGEEGQGEQDTIVTPSDSIAGDLVSQYLKLVNATKISGQPPAGVDGAIWNDVKDTIFLMRGLPIGERVTFLHDPAMNVTGFYVYIPGASYYYDVPSVPEEAKDSTDVVYIDAEFPIADFKDYPISFPIHIMPYVDNLPFKTFIRIVVIQDPKDSDDIDLCDNILGKFWQWEFTIRKYNDQILNFWAPGIRISTNVILGGCCRDDGVSLLASDLGCSKIDSLRSPRQTWVEFPVYDGTTSLFEALRFYPDGKGRDGVYLHIVGAKDEATIVPDSRDFCDRTVGMTYEYNSVVNQLIDSFYYNAVKGGGTLGIPVQTMTQANVSFLQAGSYNVEYTCNSLLIYGGGGEDSWNYVYKKINYDEIDDFRLEWYDYENNPYSN